MFSIVVPLYNKAEYLINTIDSVLAQTFQEFEILIINDGSTDDSLRIANSFQHSSVKVFDKHNEGVSAARNFGMDHASYEYIAFLDADDFWEPEYLEQMKVLISQNDQCGMFASAHKIIYPNKTVVECENLPQGVMDNYFQLMLDNPVTWTSATIIRRSVYKDVGGFPVGMYSGQDSYMWTKIAIKYKVAFTPAILASYNHIYSGMHIRQSKLDTCRERWLDFYTPGNYYLNEFIAKKALIVGLRYVVSLHTHEASSIAKAFSYTKLYKRKLLMLNLLISISPRGIPVYKSVYERYIKLKRLI